jgi:hypothetical protein
MVCYFGPIYIKKYIKWSSLIDHLDTGYLVLYSDAIQLPDKYVQYSDAIQLPDKYVWYSDAIQLLYHLAIRHLFVIQIKDMSSIQIPTVSNHLKASHAPNVND